ncbi:DMT family transporter [Salinarimonas rosea]|uniref:DMT family transporter n=1 Tax=Salinarimonas rosea TaxID=552063 RepID=UPI00041C2B06|nr:DMT family transporter [Salinarimonas rosea]
MEPRRDAPHDDGSGNAGSGEGPSQAATYARLAVGMAFFGSATPVSKIVTQAMPVFVGSALRVAIGALVLAPIVWRRRREVRRLSRKDWMLAALIALFGMFGFSALMLYGMGMVSGVTGAIVMSTAPAVTAAASVVFMRDAVTWRKIAAIALAVTGVLVLQLGGEGGSGSGANEGSSGVSWLGVGLVFGAVCCEAAYTLLGKRVSRDVDPVLVAFLAAAMSIPLFVPFAIWQWSGFDAASVDARAWIAVAWYGAGTLALGSWLWYAGVARTQGSIAAGFMAVMPTSALLLSYALLGEPFAWIHLVGFAIVLAGVLLIAWEHARASG